MINGIDYNDVIISILGKDYTRKELADLEMKVIIKMDMDGSKEKIVFLHLG